MNNLKNEWISTVLSWGRVEVCEVLFRRKCRRIIIAVPAGRDDLDLREGRDWGRKGGGEREEMGGGRGGVEGGEGGGKEGRVEGRRGGWREGGASGRKAGRVVGGDSGYRVGEFVVSMQVTHEREQERSQQAWTGKSKHVY